MKVKQFILAIIISIFFLNCSNKKQMLFGTWYIGSIKSNNHNYEDILLGNSFSFYDKNILKAARMLYHSDQYNGTWDVKINEGQIDTLFIKADNKIYERSYKVIFLKNNINSRLFMQLKADTLEVVLYKYFRTKKERDVFINKYDIETNQVPDSYFPQLKKFPDNWKTFD